ncbi:MAG: LacI family transcriptional regulator [Clostridiales bacterium]|uniref:LacI family transcriptional regulator n=1 Tax=Harryflintia acetispora TaxID=1849041 RepID=A0A9X8UI23_9FIRM|nr:MULTISPECIES: LacI family DNA-binding transcriptional regulator [Oscillospiraceae]PWM37832.1 MAG: LacI family transcriptional regulator [Clostridiales bacterium]RGB65740.1 LacI family transcriptional regulator [Harryflintia acetispora]TCL41323.1 LacI family transcriptional regulator [Harryflintia acetispora]
MTIKDIAKESGYAVSTVSRALNNHPDVSAEAKERIAQVVARYGFVPNSNARQLKQQQSSNIVLIVKGISNLFFSGIVEQMQNLISSNGYSAVVHYLSEEADEVLVAGQLCREHKPLGLLFLGGNAENFERRFGQIETPSVLVTAPGKNLDFPNLSSVGIDDVAAGREAVDYLFAKGHQKIGIIGGRLCRSQISQLRFEGCRQSFLNHGQELREEYFQIASFSYAGGYRAMQELMLRCPAISAVFCMSDIMAVGAIRAAQDAGKRVPQDVSVIGFDGIELGRYFCPRLATIQQPQGELAQISVELLVSHIEKNTPVRAVPVQVRLLEGESVRAL